MHIKVDNIVVTKTLGNLENVVLRGLVVAGDLEQDETIEDLVRFKDLVRMPIKFDPPTEGSFTDVDALTQEQLVEWVKAHRSYPRLVAMYNAAKRERTEKLFKIEE